MLISNPGLSREGDINPEKMYQNYKLWFTSLFKKVLKPREKVEIFKNKTTDVDTSIFLKAGNYAKNDRGITVTYV